MTNCSQRRATAARAADTIAAHVRMVGQRPASAAAAAASGARARSRGMPYVEHDGRGFGRCALAVPRLGSGLPSEHARRNDSGRVIICNNQFTRLSGTRCVDTFRAFARWASRVRAWLPARGARRGRTAAQTQCCTRVSGATFAYVVDRHQWLSAPAWRPSRGLLWCAARLARCVSALCVRGQRSLQRTSTKFNTNGIVCV